MRKPGPGDCHCSQLQLSLCMADLLRMEALMTLTLTDDELGDWYTTPYWKRVLISLGAMPLVTP